MHDDRQIRPVPNSQHGGGTEADDPIGEIQLGQPSGIGRRARLLAGLVTSTAAAVMLAAGTPDTGTSHSGPLG
ncbi:hypothetical protein V6U77_14595 [Micromonospora sp. CPCC 205546]|uniref:hypothetical protein n=1 Tax=Micromonospora sp. CPCC 205546 TaxID=3122397 RepID=UPI002FF34858